MLFNRTHLLLLHSLALHTSLLNGMEHPSVWLKSQNAKALKNFPSPEEEDLSFKKPSFQLHPHEKITAKLTEHRMDQLFKEAPSSLKGRKNTLIKNMTGRLSSANILLEGPAGTGKTSLALAIAYKCKSPYVFIAGSRLANSFKNSAPEFIEALFKTLRTAQRNALIIDEFTAFTAKLNNRNDSDTGAVEDFWIALDQHRHKYNLIFMATTNEVDKIPGALRDRFGELHHIGNPSESLRLMILEDSPLVSIYHDKLKKLVKSTDGFSLRDLELLYIKAVDFANEREPNSAQNTAITCDDIESALHHVKKASQIKANSVTENINNQKWENFNRYRLPLIGFSISSIAVLAGLWLNHYQGKKNIELQKENHNAIVLLQKAQNDEMMKFQKQNHQDQLKQNEKFHEENIQLQKSQFQEQLENQTKNALLQGVAAAVANSTFANEALTEGVCEGVDFTVDLIIRNSTILWLLPIRTRTLIKPLIRPVIRPVMPYIIGLAPQWIPLTMKNQNNTTVNNETIVNNTEQKTL